MPGFVSAVARLRISGYSKKKDELPKLWGIYLSERFAISSLMQKFPLLKIPPPGGEGHHFSGSTALEAGTSRNLTLRGGKVQ